MSAAGAAASVGDAIGTGTVPRHADEERAVMTEVGRPPLLRIGHQGAQIALHRGEIEFREFLRVVEFLAHWIGLRRVLAQDRQAKLLGPPVAVVTANASFRVYRTRRLGQDSISFVRRATGRSAAKPHERHPFMLVHEMD